jgi:hypothetical protein
MKCRPRRLTNQQDKSALSMYFRMLLFLPLFLLKAKYDDGRVRGG